MNRHSRRIMLGLAAAGLCGAAAAQDTSAPDNAGVFTLGEIIVVKGWATGRPSIGGSVVTTDDMWTFAHPTLDQAVNLTPGVNSQFDSNGRRNESDIFVRGFGRWQVPLLMDGVRVYLPADNRIDFARFTTGDIAAIQIQKGYASVIDGPGGMGGAINLVSRKPVKTFEAEVQAGAAFGDGAGMEGWNGYARAGSRQENYYVQGSAAYYDRDYFTLSDDYTPTQNSLQQTRRRINSGSTDWRVNFKAGFTPNGTDEYTVNYIRQEGEKGGLLNVYNNPQVPPNSFWRWPYWNMENIAFLSNTRLGAASYLKTKFYYNTFDNLLSAFDDITYTTQSANGRFDSYYADDAYGTSLEFGTALSEANTLKAAFHYRRDSHTEYQDNRPTNAAARTIEPPQDQAQSTLSAAVEDTFHITPDFDLVGGVSYDEFKIRKAEEFSAASGIFEYPKGGANAFNWQAAAIWRYGAAGEIHAAVSDRSRFPIIFELFSTRFGTAVPNPDLGPERATNLELGWDARIAAGVQASAAVFYSDVRNLVQTVQLPGTPVMTQTRNVGDGEFYGFEAAVDAAVAPQLDVGGNYTYIHRTIKDALQPNLRPTGVPTHKAFLYMTWRPAAALSLTPSLEIAGKRWSDRATNPAQVFPYIRTGGYEMLNLQAAYEIAPNVEIAAGAKNLLDQNVELSWGLPQPGRNFYLKTRANF